MSEFPYPEPVHNLADRRGVERLVESDQTFGVEQRSFPVPALALVLPPEREKEIYGTWAYTFY